MLPPSFDFENDLSLTSILDNIDAGIAIYDEKGNFIFVNAKLIQWRNTPRQEYLKKNIHDFVNYLDVCVFDLVCQRKERVCRLQYYKSYPVDSGPPRIRMVTATPIFDEHGNVRYVISIMQDVREFEEQVHELLSQTPMLSVKDAESAENFDIIGKSPIMSQLMKIAENVAQLDSTVMLTGESGVGKEVFAHYIHEHSSRHGKRMVTVNCAAFPENLIESELFGYERGSFTGASSSGKTGLVEAADGGTLFLDEVNSLPLSVQGKLLRVLEEKSIQRIGSIKPRNVDFRLICATNEDLARLVEQGRFREDLFYRIHVIPLRIPPLRERKDDINPLCQHFLQYFCEKYRLRKAFSDEVLRQMQAYSWPGNVRELRNFVERMVVMTPSTSEIIWSIPEGLLFNREEPKPVPAPILENRPKTLSKEVIETALSLCGNHRGRTAEYLGISRRYLQYKIREYHIDSRCRYD